MIQKIALPVGAVDLLERLQRAPVRMGQKCFEVSEEVQALVRAGLAEYKNGQLQLLADFSD